MNKEKGDKSQIIERILKISLLGVLIRLVLNAFANFLSSSQSLHTIFVDASLDVFLSVMSLFVLNATLKKANTIYPYGYGKIEYIWNFMQGVCLFLVNVFLIIATLQKFFHKEMPNIEKNSTALMLASAVLTALICFLEYNGWKKTQSSLIYANFINHMADIFVYFMGGIAVWGANKGFQNLDWIMALLIAFIVGYEGLKLCYQSVIQLCDHSLPKKQLEILKEDIWKNLCFPLGWHCRFIRSRNGGNIQFAEINLQIPENCHLKDIDHHLRIIKDLWRKKFLELEPVFSFTVLKVNTDVSENVLLKNAP